MPLAALRTFIQKHRRALIWLVAVIVLGGIAYWAWTTPQFDKRTGFDNKTLWDLTDLLLAPLVLAVVAYLFSERQKQAELKSAAAERENDRQIARDREEASVLQTYFDRMSDLLLTHELREKPTKENAEERSVARALTLATLRRLNGERKGMVINFLFESGLIGLPPRGSPPIIHLHGANLHGANLDGVNLHGANLHGANLHGANLHGANLDEANLNAVDLQGANLQAASLKWTFLKNANLHGANLDGASLHGTNLQGANLQAASLRANLKLTSIQLANLQGANLQGAVLDSANLYGANLQGANLHGAMLIYTNFQGANLDGANLNGISLHGINRGLPSEVVAALRTPTTQELPSDLLEILLDSQPASAPTSE